MGQGIAYSVLLGDGGQNIQHIFSPCKKLSTQLVFLKTDNLKKRVLKFPSKGLHKFSVKTELHI